MDIVTISILTVIVGCIVGLAEWVRFVKNDAGAMAAQISSLETKLEYFEEQITELKHDEEVIEATVQKALEEKIVNEGILALLQEKLKVQEPILPTKK